MTLVVPNVGEQSALNKLLNQNLTLKLFSNNITPGETDTAASYTEVSGGGYASKPLTFANWTVTPGAPTAALYNAAQDFSFTGATGAPSTIYGYYIVDGSNVLILAERFAPAVVPFTPIAGSLIRITPRIEAS